MRSLQKKTSNKSSHGGVLIAVDKRFESELYLHGDLYGCEQLWVKIVLERRVIYLDALCVSSGSNFSLYETNMKLTNQLRTSVDTNGTIFLCGEFILPQLCTVEEITIDEHK